MKLKYYLRGIGIGLIVTTLVMMIAFMMHKDELLTDDEIRERAAELGMVMPEDAGMRDTLSNNNATQPENAKLEDESADAVDKASQEQEDASGQSEDESKTGKEDSDQEDSGKKDQTKKDDADKKEGETEKPEVKEQVELSIVGGEYSDIVSHKLYKAGLIEDPEDFNKYLADGGYDNLIQPGTYTIPAGADYDAIIKIITEKND